MVCRHVTVVSAALGTLMLSGVGFAAALSAPDTVRVYRWTDDKGIVHYGDTIPAEYSDSERSVLNGRGVVVGHVEGSKSAAQMDEQVRAEQLARQQAQHDQFLLTTYVSAKDIEELRDQRLDQIDGQIKASTSYIDSLGARLAALEERAMQYKPYSSAPGAQRMPDDLAEELVRTTNEDRTQRATLESKRKAEADTRAQFEADLERFRALTSHHP
jgi:hypothetical protein